MNQLVFSIGVALLSAWPAFAEGSLDFESLMDTEIRGGAVYVSSQSFIHPAGDRLHAERAFKIPADVLNGAVAGYLCVTGESARPDSVADMSVQVRTVARYQKRSLEILYHDVFRFDPKDVPWARGGKDTGGLVTVKSVRSDVVNPTGKFKFSTAAATVIVVYRTKDPAAKRIRLFAGLSAPTPGDVYTFRFDRGSPKHHPVSLMVAGGHGIKGNATGNMLNGSTLSGGDDWDGSAGILWDFDRYNLKKWSFGDIIEYKFGIDTILNWIYPEILIFEEEVRL